MKCQPGCSCRRHSAGPKIAAKLAGRTLPAAHREAIARGLTGNVRQPCPSGCACGRHFPSAERGRRISAARSGQALTHGLFGHPLYNTWAGIMARCLNSNHPQFRYWGGRGITICEEWRDCAAFIAWMESPDGIGHRPEGDFSIDRINNEGHYEPGNVRWATRSEQSRNRRPFRQGR